MRKRRWICGLLLSLLIVGVSCEAPKSQEGKATSGETAEPSESNIGSEDVTERRSALKTPEGYRPVQPPIFKSSRSHPKLIEPSSLKARGFQTTDWPSRRPTKAAVCIKSR
jgi:hypothetical protein